MWRAVTSPWLLVFPQIFCTHGLPAFPICLNPSTKPFLSKNVTPIFTEPGEYMGLWCFELCSGGQHSSRPEQLHTSVEWMSQEWDVQTQFMVLFPTDSKMHSWTGFNLEDKWYSWNIIQWGRIQHLYSWQMINVIVRIYCPGGVGVGSKDCDWAKFYFTGDLWDMCYNKNVCHTEPGW